MRTAIDVTPGQADFPRNCWYVAAFGFEVTREPMHRMLFGDPVVLFRSEAGEPVALFDRCPHRGMRLSNGGQLVGDNIQCNYHGIQFGTNGRACLIPSGGVPTSAMRVRRYPLREIGGWIWAWAGDPEHADEALLPDHDELGLTAPGMFAYYGAVLTSESNYLFSLENLMDATHITFLHHGLIDTGHVAAHPYRCEQEGARVSMFREFSDEEISPMMQQSMQLKGTRADRLLELRSYVPNVAIVRQVFTEPGEVGIPKRESRLVFGVTPGGAKSCYQFVAVAQNYEGSNAGRFDALRNLLMEDVVALDDIQKLFDMLAPDQRVEVSVKADEGAIRSRRILAAMLADERDAMPVAAE